MSEIRTVVDLFERAAAERPQRAMLRSRVGGSWQSQTFAQWRERSAAWAKGLIALGHQPGDRVLLISNTCSDWVVADMAILLAGGVTVPIYQSSLADETRYIAADSGARFAIVEDPTQVEKLLLSRAELPRLDKVIYFKDLAELDRPDAQGRRRVALCDIPKSDVQDWLLDTTALGASGRAIGDETLRERAAAIDPAEAATIVYTSGTTGRPKGVVLSHKALVFEVGTVVGALDVREDDSVLLFLPLAHSFAKIVYFMCIGVRTEIIFPESIATLVRDLGESRPTVLPSVPRIFEKVHARILQGARENGALKRRIFEYALAIGHEVSALQQHGKEPAGLLLYKQKLAQRLVFSKIQAIFGGRLRGCISGGAPLSKDLCEFFHACGILILEGYGLTENCAAATINRPDRYKFGTVGRPLDGVDLQIASDGEILMRGRNLLTGYHNDAAATSEALEGGWFHTGDIGEIDDDGFLRITDRKKDIIVTAGGKNVAPQNIENHLKSSPFLSQVLLYGDRRKFLSALLTLDEEAIRKWADDHALTYNSTAELTQNASVYQLIESIIAEKNRTLASYETIKKFAILERDLTVEDGELTPSLKLRRKEVTRKYQDLLDSFYSEHY